MMYSIFNEEYAREQYERAMQREKRENEAKIRAEAYAEGYAKGRAATIKEALANLIKSGMTEQQAREILKL